MAEAFRLLEQGERLLAEQRLEEAIERFRRYLDDQPDDPEGHYNLGLALFEKARTMRPSCASRGSSTSTPRIRAATTAWPWSSWTGVNTRAPFQYYQRATERDPDNADLFNEMGIIYQELGDGTQALEMYEKGPLPQPEPGLSLLQQGPRPHGPGALRGGPSAGWRSR